MCHVHFPQRYSKEFGGHRCLYVRSFSLEKKLFCKFITDENAWASTTLPRSALLITGSEILRGIPRMTKWTCKSNGPAWRALTDTHTDGTNFTSSTAYAGGEKNSLSAIINLSGRNMVWISSSQDDQWPLTPRLNRKYCSRWGPGGEIIVVRLQPL